MTQPEPAGHAAHPDDTRTLVEAAQRGDRAAQQALWRRHRRWVAAIVLVHRPRELDVDDLMQDVAVKFIDKIDTLRDPGAFRPWLRQVILNVCRGAARSLKPTLSLDVGTTTDDDAPARLPAPAATDGGVARSVEHPDAAQRVLAQAQSLPPEYREPLLLRCVRSLTYAQIAQTLELPVTTIETRLARARRMLREELTAQPSDRGDLTEHIFLEGL